MELNYGFSYCDYFLTQNMYSGISVGTCSGRDVAIQLTQPYFDKGHVVYCHRFFLTKISSRLRTRKMEW